MANNINWIGNRVMDQTSTRQPPRAAPPEARPAAGEATIPATPAAPPVTPPMASGPTMTPPSASMPSVQQGPPPVADRGFIPYYLTSNIGRFVRAEFILGNSTYMDKTGRLIEVGINYFVLEDVNSRTHIMCDLYSVRFVTILMDGNSRPF